MKKISVLGGALAVVASLSLSPTYAAPCPFDNTKTCDLFRNILNDRDAAGLRYYGATNYDHRFSGEIELFDSSLVQPYTDQFNVPGQIKLIANRTGNPAFKAGEIMTRVNLDQPPYNSPTKIHPFTTEDLQHGYIEAIVKLPKCDVSDDGLCQNGTNPQDYNRGMWPSIWLLPTFDTNWPQNGEIDIWEAYQLGRDFNVTTATIHFNGNDPRCGGNDCKFIGYPLAVPAANAPLYQGFHTWGFEWQPDPASGDKGVIMTGYFDNVKVWGPLRTDTLPADGPNAFSRGFNDPAGGFYLIAALALGGGYAGNPNGHLQSASMYLQSIKVFSVNGVTPPPTNKCLPPANINYSWTPDKKSITLTWQQPAGSDTINTYQVNDWMNRLMWTGNTLTFTDKTLPGTDGDFVYFLYSNCPSGQSAGVKVDAIIKGNPPPTNQCLPPANMTATPSADKKSVLLTWQAPAGSLPILNYQISTCQNRVLWTGNALQFNDTTLSGKSGSFSYVFYSNCAGGLSNGAPFTVTTLHGKTRTFNYCR